MSNITKTNVHISNIYPNDTVEHMGHSLFGDSYRLGYKPVVKITFNLSDNNE